MQAKTYASSTYSCRESDRAGGTQQQHGEEVPQHRSERSAGTTQQQQIRISRISITTTTTATTAAPAAPAAPCNKAPPQKHQSTPIIHHLHPHPYHSIPSSSHPHSQHVTSTHACPCSSINVLVCIVPLHGTATSTTSGTAAAAASNSLCSQGLRNATKREVNMGMTK